MRFLFLVVLLFSVSACVESLSESVERVKRQTILVQTPHVLDAKCRLTDRKGYRWRVENTPNVVTVRNGHSPLTVICTRDGYKKTIVQIEEENVNFENYPGFFEEVSALLQDPYANIATKYPNEIYVWMEPHQWQSDAKMREWAYEKQIYERQQAAIIEKREAEERRLKELEIKLRAKHQETIKQQRNHLHQAWRDTALYKWFRQLRIGTNLNPFASADELGHPDPDSLKGLDEELKQEVLEEARKIVEEEKLSEKKVDKTVDKTVQKPQPTQRFVPASQEQPTENYSIGEPLTLEDLRRVE